MKILLPLAVLILVLTGCIFFKDSDTPRSAKKEKRKEAIRLYHKALKLEEEKEYEAARECYEKSLALHESNKVSKAYLRLLSAMGPM